MIHSLGGESGDAKIARSSLSCVGIQVFNVLSYLRMHLHLVGSRALSLTELCLI